MYLSKDNLFSTLTTLAEQDHTSAALGGVVRIRELSALERQDVVRAANASGTFDGAIWAAATVQCGVIDADSKQPLFTPSDVERLTRARGELLRELADAIWALSEATSDALKSGDHAIDAGQPDAGRGAETGSTDV